MCHFPPIKELSLLSDPNQELETNETDGKTATSWIGHTAGSEYLHAAHYSK